HRDVERARAARHQGRFVLAPDGHRRPITEYRTSSRTAVGKPAAVLIQAAPMRCSLALRVASSNGLVTNPSAPAAMPRPTVAGSFSVVQNTTFGCWPSGFARSAVTN